MLASRKMMALIILTGAIVLMAVTDPLRLESVNSMSSTTAALSGDDIYRERENMGAPSDDDAAMWTSAAPSGEGHEERIHGGGFSAARALRRHAGRTAPVQGQLAALCTCNFVAYTSSPNEQRWIENVALWQDDVCTHLPEGEITDLLAAIADLRKDESAMVRINGRREPDLAEWKSLFSAFTYDCSCDGEQSYVHVAIEPAVGLNRDNRKCWEPTTERYTQSKEYLLPLSLHAGGPGTGATTVAAVHVAHESRRTQTFLFDAGAHIAKAAGADTSWNDAKILGDNGGATDWIVKWYGPSVKFDHVYAWALPSTRVNFDVVDPELIPMLHYYPHGVTDPTQLLTEKDTFDVLSVIKKVCRPEDFVVFKLDIDTNSCHHCKTDIEENIARTVMTDPEIQALIDEFYWEKHIHNRVMAMHGMGGRKGVPKLQDWYSDVIPARKRGLRMHGWP